MTDLLTNRSKSQGKVRTMDLLMNRSSSRGKVQMMHLLRARRNLRRPRTTTDLTSHSKMEMGRRRRRYIMLPINLRHLQKLRRILEHPQLKVHRLRPGRMHRFLSRGQATLLAATS